MRFSTRLKIIPKYVFSTCRRLFDIFNGCFSCVKVNAQGLLLRHEYAHALEDNYEQFVHVKAFVKAFGAEYGDTVVFKEGTEENYISLYAQSMTQEDFAETFMYYMKYKGKLPEKWSDNRATRAKWSFFDDLRAKIYEQL